jgi:hypothetical protein
LVRTHESTLQPSKYQSSLSRANDSPAGSFSFLVSVIGAPGMIVKSQDSEEEPPPLGKSSMAGRKKGARAWTAVLR